MNELQQVLLVFAVVVIAGLYFLSRSRQVAIKKDSKTADQDNESNGSYQKASHELNELGEPHIPVSQATIDRLGRNKGQSDSEEPECVYNENQGVLSFGQEFDLPAEFVEEASAEPVTKVKLKTSENTEEASKKPVSNDEQSKARGGKHHVLVVEDPGMNGEGAAPTAVAEDFVPSFGIPEEQAGQSPGVSVGEKKNAEVYVIMVMSVGAGHEFTMTDLNQALLGVGLVFSNNGIYVKLDNMGNSIIRVANLLEPGIFPTEDFENYLTPGVAMILELPSTVRAPAAMHDLIMMARKVSQRLQGRLYNMERHLIKESDLQSMRDAAVEYESQPI
ncbi:MAG: cell division protein ZipA [Thiomicrorhabdus sp.]|nr:MAG: cell division protein ZipA [Thiomicrorhabdus sp.]